MVIKRNNKSECAEPRTSEQQLPSEHDTEQRATKLAYRRKLDEATFEWSKEPLPELTLKEAQAIRSLKLSVNTARRIKQMRLEGFRYKQILLHLRGQKGFSKSSVSKIHAALARVQKQTKT